MVSCSGFGLPLHARLLCLFVTESGSRATEVKTAFMPFQCNFTVTASLHHPYSLTPLIHARNSNVRRCNMDSTLMIDVITCPYARLSCLDPHPTRSSSRHEYNSPRFSPRLCVTLTKPTHPHVAATGSNRHRHIVHWNQTHLSTSLSLLRRGIILAATPISLGRLFGGLGSLCLIPFLLLALLPRHHLLHQLLQGDAVLRYAGE